MSEEPRQLIDLCMVADDEKLVVQQCLSFSQRSFDWLSHFGDPLQDDHPFHIAAASCLYVASLSGADVETEQWRHRPFHADFSVAQFAIYFAITDGQFSITISLDVPPADPEYQRALVWAANHGWTVQFGEYA